ncbi:hypothetical protein RFI_18096 [Reticulomyxa filosa]|uniref:Uncharacterized protein n=1 Tax=Reticulomyxa filosa TaxID=46433 RepID=X6MZR3_RETFI|nr:hypothetical protein RFI_18096 [Reticulomyxa filosa]|eukprot:ETO19143.1 hypothetical protein RFI_18096 [Reticulomyxa filosa]
MDVRQGQIIAVQECSRAGQKNYIRDFYWVVSSVGNIFVVTHFGLEIYQLLVQKRRLQAVTTYKIESEYHWYLVCVFPSKQFALLLSKDRVFTGLRISDRKIEPTKPFQIFNPEHSAGKNESKHRHSISGSNRNGNKSNSNNSNNNIYDFDLSQTNFHHQITLIELFVCLIYVYMFLL